MITSVAQYILAVMHLEVMSRSLGAMHIHPIFEEGCNDKLRCSVGNSVIVFEVMQEGKHKAMRVYMRQHRNLRAIYGEGYFPKELLVNASDTEFGLSDVVLCDWHEGVSLQAKIEELCCKPTKMAALSHLFEEFALTLLGERWAHGDIKPENIIVTNEGLQLIDFDAMYLEGFGIDDCEELGTRQFQHPLRDKSNFGRDIDDYPIALIATALTAMTLDETLGRNIRKSDHLLIQPHLAIKGEDEMLQRIETLFAERGDIRHYRIAQLLRSPQPALPQLRNLLEAHPLACDSADNLTLEYYNGYWGFAENGRFVIPPLYDIAFDFSEGLALVRVGDVWHFINHTGEVVITCGRGSQIKPFRNGQTTIRRPDGEIVTIYRNTK